MKKLFLRFSGSLGVVALLWACGGSPSALPSGDVHVDEDGIVRGVDDKGRDPAVVAVDVDGQGLCSGALIAPDAVLTARHCVEWTEEHVSCPPAGPQVGKAREPGTLAILVGDDVATARVAARGREIVVPAGAELCDGDIAVLLLDQPILGITPLALREAGIAQGDHVRSVGYGKRTDSEAGGTKLLREHVRVLDATPFEFRVGEATCQGDSGGPAFDEANGEIVGVVSRGGPSCDGNGVHNIYTRTDAFLSLIGDALAEDSTDDDAGASMSAADSGKTKKHKDAGSRGKKKDAGSRGQKLPTDLGGECKKGDECATGACVTQGARQYCSQGCAAQDPCPTHFKCLASVEGELVCAEK